MSFKSLLSSNFIVFLANSFNVVVIAGKKTTFSDE